MTDSDATYLYEEPSSLHPADWERFCAVMQEEVNQHPERRHASEALAFAQRMLRDIRHDPAPKQK